MRRLAALFALACACASDPDVASEHVDLFLDGEIEVCGGELARADAFIEHVAELWTGMPANDLRLELHAVSDAREHGCGEKAVGCRNGSSLRFDHQIVQDSLAVQAIVAHLDGRSARFFESGLPIALAPYNAFGYAKSQVADFDPTLLSNAMPDVYDEGKQGIIAAWLLERYGGPAVRSYFHALAPSDHRDHTNFVDEFTNSFDEPFESGWADLATSSRCASRSRFCEFGTTIELPFELTDFDCSDADTIGYSAPSLEADKDRPYRPQQIFLLDNDATRSLVVDVTAGSVYVVACDACPAELWLASASDEFLPSESQLDVPPGKYAFIVSADGDEAALTIAEAP